MLKELGFGSSGRQYTNDSRDSMGKSMNQKKKSFVSPLRSAIEARHPSVCVEVAETLGMQISALVESDEEETPTTAATVAAPPKMVETDDACVQTVRRGPYELDQKELKFIREGDGDGMESMQERGVILADDASDDLSLDVDDEPDYEPPDLDKLFSDGRGVFNPARRIYQVLAGCSDKDGVSADALGRQARPYGALTLLERAKWMLVKQEETVLDHVRQNRQLKQVVLDNKAEIINLQKQLRKTQQLLSVIQASASATQAGVDGSGMLLGATPPSMPATSPPLSPVSPPLSPGATPQVGPRSMRDVVRAMNLTSPKDDQKGAAVLRGVVDNLKQQQQEQRQQMARELNQARGAETSMRSRAILLATSIGQLVATYCSAMPAGPAQPPPYTAFSDWVISCKSMFRKGGVLMRMLDDAEVCGGQVDRARALAEEALAKVESLSAIRAPAPSGSLQPDPVQHRRVSMHPRVSTVSTTSASAANILGLSDKEADPTRETRERRLCAMLQQILDVLDFQMSDEKQAELEEAAKEGMRRDREACRAAHSGEISTVSLRLQRLIFTCKEAAMTRQGNLGAIHNAVEALKGSIDRQAEAARKAGYSKEKRGVPDDVWIRVPRELKNIKDSIGEIIAHSSAEAVITAEHRWGSAVLKINEERSAREEQALDALAELRAKQDARLRLLRHKAAQCLVRSVLARLKLKGLEGKSSKYSDFVIFGLRRAYLNQLAFLGLRRQQLCVTMYETLFKDWENEKSIVLPLFFPWKKAPKPRTEVDGRKAKNPPPVLIEPPSRLNNLWEALSRGLNLRSDVFGRSVIGGLSAREAIMKSQYLVSKQMTRLRTLEKTRAAEMRKLREKTAHLSAYNTRMARGMFNHDVMRDFQPKRVNMVGQPEGWSSARTLAADRSAHMSGGVGALIRQLKDHLQGRKKGAQPIEEEKVRGTQCGSPSPRLGPASDPQCLPPIQQSGFATAVTPPAPAPPPARPAGSAHRPAPRSEAPASMRTAGDFTAPEIVGNTAPLVLGSGGGRAPVMLALVSDVAPRPRGKDG
eukprot:Hpha_TRINITY_DN29900_c0_g1::TRINITY_DN29900_c0_g1_i1::g.131897::m.131897